MAHCHLHDLDVHAFRPGLSLCNTNSTQLRVGKDGIGYQPSLDTGGLAFEEIGANDAIVVIRDMGKRGTTFNVAQCVHSSGAGLEVIIRLMNPLALVSTPAASGFKVSVFGVRAIAASRCEPVKVRAPCFVSICRRIVFAWRVTFRVRDSTRSSTPSSWRIPAIPSATSPSSFVRS